MNKTYYISKNSVGPKSNNYTNLNIEQIDSIPNHSANAIVCDCLEYIELHKLPKIFNKILSSLGPGATLDISIYNLKYDVKQYISNKIDSLNLLNNIKNYSNILSLDYIMSLLDNQQFNIQQIIENNNRINIHIVRHGL